MVKLKYFKYAIILGLVMILLAGFIIMRSVYPPLSYLKEFGPLWLPQDTKLISSFDDGDYSIRAKLQFKTQADVRDFIEKNKLATINKKFPQKYFVCLTEKHSLEVEMQETNTEVEIKIGYPDRAGMSSCDPSQSNL